MPIALTCSCGAKLEIDDAFAGKTIPCPDCQRPLAAVPAARPDQKTSVLAMSSLFLALAGGFTLIGGLIAAGLGVLALMQIKKSEGKLEGRKLALAGVVLGVGFTLASAALLFLRGPFGISQSLRGLEWAGRLDYPVGDSIVKQTPLKDHPISMGRPPGFGQVILKDYDATTPDDILLYNPWEDAYLVLLAHYPDVWPDNLIDGALSRLEQSDMMRMLLLGRLPKKGEGRDAALQALIPEGFGKKPHNYEGKTYSGISWSIYHFDNELNGRERTFLVYFAKLENTVLLVAAGVTRKERFERLRPALESALQTAYWKRSKRE